MRYDQQHGGSKKNKKKSLLGTFLLKHLPRIMAKLEIETILNRLRFDFPFNRIVSSFAYD